MGFFNSFFGGKSNATKTSSTRLDPYWDQATKGLYDSARNLGQEPYRGWTSEERLAPLNEIDKKAIAAGGTVPFAYKSYLDKAGAAMGDFELWPDANRAEYTNPYATDVSQRALRDFQETYNQGLTRARSRAPSLSALASPNQQTQEMLMEREYERGFGDLSGKLRAAEYEDAYSKWAADQQRKRDASAGYGQLAEATSQLGLQNLQAQRDAGEYQRQLEDQRYRDWNYEEFMRAQEWPYKQITFQKGIMQGMPMGEDTKTTMTGMERGSIFGNILGGLSSLTNIGKGVASIFGSGDGSKK